MIEILAVVVIIGILVAIAVPIISRYINQGKEKYYRSLEDELVIIARDYYTKNKSELPRGQYDANGVPMYINQVSLSTLIDRGYVTNDIVDADKNPCTGYVRVENKSKGEYEYISCIKCGDKYTSEKNNAYCTLYENFDSDDYGTSNGALLCNIDTGSYSNDTWTNQDVTATITSSYENGTAAQIGMYKNASTGVTIRAINNQATISIKDYGSLKVYTYDRLGNRGECTIEGIKIDKENPSVTFTSSNVSTSNSGIKVTATLKDNNGVVAYQVNQSSNSPTDGWTTINETKETTFTTDYLTTSDSTTYYIWTKDVAGNVNKKRIIVGLTGWSDPPTYNQEQYWCANEGLCQGTEEVCSLCTRKTKYSSRNIINANYTAWSGYTATPCTINQYTCESTSGYTNYKVNYPTYNTTNRLMKEGGITGATPGVSGSYCYQFRLTTNVTFTKYGCSQSVGYTTPSYDATNQKCHCKYGGGTLDDAMVKISSSVSSVAPGVDGDYCYQPNSKITHYYDKYYCSSGTIQYQSGKCKCPYCSTGELYESSDYGQYMCRTNEFANYSTSSYGYWGVETTLYRTRSFLSYEYGDWTGYITETACDWNNTDICLWRYEYQTRSYTYSLD